MNTGGKVALAVSVGYLLGRTRKLKLALALGLLVAGSKLPKDPMELVRTGIDALGKNDQFAGLSKQLGGNLTEAGKLAAAKSAERFLVKFTERVEGDSSNRTTDSSPDDDSSTDPEDEKTESQSKKTQPKKTTQARTTKKTTSSRSSTTRGGSTAKRGSGTSSRTRKG